MLKLHYFFKKIVVLLFYNSFGFVWGKSKEYPYRFVIVLLIQGDGQPAPFFDFYGRLTYSLTRLNDKKEDGQHELSVEKFEKMPNYTSVQRVCDEHRQAIRAAGHDVDRVG